MFRKGMRWRALGIREPVRGLKVVRSGKRRTWPETCQSLHPLAICFWLSVKKNSLWNVKRPNPGQSVVFNAENFNNTITHCGSHCLCHVFQVCSQHQVLDVQGSQPHDSRVQRRELQSLNTTPGRHNSQKRARHKGGDLDVVDLLILIILLVLTLLMMVILIFLTMVILTLLIMLISWLPTLILFQNLAEILSERDTISHTMQVILCMFVVCTFFVKVSKM